MKAKHTPPPWTVHHFIRDDMTPQDLGLYEIEEVNERFNDMLNDDPNSLGKVIAEANANAARIVACVNACAGIPTADLATGVVPVDVVRRLVEAAKASRRLLNMGRTLEAIHRGANLDLNEHKRDIGEIIDEIGAAIAAAEQAMAQGAGE